MLLLSLTRLLLLLLVVINAYPTTEPILSFPLKKDNRTAYYKHPQFISHFSSFLQSNQTNSNNVVRMPIWKNAMYYLMVGFGTPIQQQKLLIDTGSSNTWTQSTLCSNCDVNQQQEILVNQSSVSYPYDMMPTSPFDPQQSQTFMYLNKSEQQLKYGTGQVSILQVRDLLTIGQVKGVMDFGVSIWESRQLSLFDGILGLGFPALALHHSETVLEALYTQQLIQHKVFTYSILGDSGSFEIGSSDDVQQWVEVSKPLYWQVNLETMYYGNEQIQVHDPKAEVHYQQLMNETQVIFDTGTNVLALPPFISKQVLSKMQAHLLPFFDIYFYKCTKTSQLQPLKFVFKSTDGEIVLEMQPESYIQSEFELFGWCILQISEDQDLERNRLAQQLILGEPFFKKYKTIFDQEHQRMGFLAMQ